MPQFMHRSKGSAKHESEGRSALTTPSTVNPIVEKKKIKNKDSANTEHKIR